MARTLIATDNFNRASLDANWAQVNSNGGTILIESSVRFRGSGANLNGPAAKWVGAGSFTDDQYSSVVIISLGNFGDNYHIGAIARASTGVDDSRDYYEARVDCDGTSTYTTKLLKYIDGTLTTLNSGSVAWSLNDRIEIECEGTTIRLCKNGTPLGGAFTQTDSALSTGLPGVAAASGDASIANGDDWEGGNMTGITTTPITVPNLADSLAGGEIV
jgi:hypothetical protein